MSDEGGHRNEGDGTDDSDSGTDTRGSDLLGGILNVLTERHRRYALYYLQEREVSDIDELARYITTTTGKTDSPPENRLQATKVQLIHADLPALDEAGFVDYDRRSETVRYSDPPSLLETALAMTRTIDRPEGLD